jgi:hypothetical protein
MKGVILILISMLIIYLTNAQNTFQIGNSSFTVSYKEQNTSENYNSERNLIMKKAKVSIDNVFLIPQFDDIPKGAMISFDEIVEKYEMNVFEKISKFLINMSTSNEFQFAIGFGAPKQYQACANCVPRVGYLHTGGIIFYSNQIKGNMEKYRVISSIAGQYSSFDQTFKNVEYVKVGLYLFFYEKSRQPYNGDFPQRLQEVHELSEIALPIDEENPHFDIIINFNKNGWMLDYKKK